MTNDEFEVLVARLDERAHRDPGGYKLRVLLLAFTGYAYLVAVLALLLVVFFGVLASTVRLHAVAIKLALPIGALAWLVLRAIWVKVTPPEGRRVTTEQCPALFAMIEMLRRALKAPAFHRILITSDFNAAVAQVPRLGMFGWHRNYLLLGLPLMKTLTAAQFEAVLAHEFGHLAGGHGRVSNWLYRLRLSWHRLVATLDAQKSWGTFLFRRFFDWYSPYFSAWSFPLARANEYEADAASARLTSPQTAAEALTGVHVIGSYLDEHFWNELHKRADDQPQPAFAPYAQLGVGLRDELDTAAVDGWLQRAMAEVTTAANTHPSLADRLKALQQAPNFAPPAAGAGAQVLLEPALSEITREFDERWQAAIKASWEQRHELVKKGRSRLAELDARVVGQPLSRDEALERATLTESCGGDGDAALAQFRTLYQIASDDPEVCFALGKRLLARDDESGVALIEQATALDDDAIVVGCAVLRDFYWRNGKKAEADASNERMAMRQRLLQGAKDERDSLNIGDKLLPHGLDEQAIADLRVQLQSVGVRIAYLVCKQVQYLPERKLFALGFTVGHWWAPNKNARAVQGQIVAKVTLPGETFVVNVGSNRKFGRRLRAQPGARIL